MIERGLGVLFLISALASPGLAAEAATEGTGLCDLLVATPLAPAGGAETGSVVTFRWRGPELGSDRLPFDLQPEYSVWVSRNQEPFVFVGSTAETVLTRFIPAGSYGWFVGASVRGCRSQRSAVARFVVPVREVCPTDAPLLVAPADGSSVDGPAVDLVWTNVEEAEGYVVWLQRDPDASIRAVLTRRLASRLDLPDGAFGWRVEALVPGCPPISSTRERFGVEGCGLARPIPLTPPDGIAGLPSPITFRWTEVEGAEEYRLYGLSSRGLLDADPVLLGTSAEGSLDLDLPEGTLEWWVDAVDGSGCRASSSPRSLTVVTISGCPAPRTPRMAGPSRVSSAQTFRLGWTPIPAAGSYELEESTDPDFASPTALPAQSAPIASLERSVEVPTLFHYRVRAVSSCSDDKSAFSPPVSVRVVPELESVDATTAATATASVGLCLVGERLRRCSEGETGDNEAAAEVSLAADRPWITIAPATVTFPPRGRATVTLTAEARGLPLGTNRASVTATPLAGSKSASQTTGGSVTVSLSLVTPVAAVPGSAPTPSTLVIPAVAHADGVDSTWESDLRLLNVSPAAIRYELSFTPSGSDGNLSGKSTQVDVAPGATLALDDVVETWYGAEGAIGSLAIRPLDEPSGFLSSAPASIASSRTFNLSSGGTFGQFIPAIRIADFIGAVADGGEPAPLRLQQIAQNDLFRTNVGLVEGAGETASVEIAVFDRSGTRLAIHPVTLLPREHRQFDQFLSETLGLTLDDGRIEVSVQSMTGRVTAYASRIDNRTGDPFVVFASPPSAELPSKWVVPGVAALDTGQANWRTDVRIHNGGQEPVEATLTFHPQDAGSPMTASVQIAPGAIAALDDVLVSTFGVANVGGALHVETEEPADLTVTAQTYNLGSAGTFGQFIPAVTLEQAVPVGGRTLQLLQVEESDRFRTNLGLAEVSGHSVTVEISAVVPESTVIPKAMVQLSPNEFLQINGIVRELNLPSTYNGRIAVRAISGSGRVTAYASMIDNVTQDPTYVPAQ